MSDRITGRMPVPRNSTFRELGMAGIGWLGRDENGDDAVRENVVPGAGLRESIGDVWRLVP